MNYNKRNEIKEWLTFNINNLTNLIERAVFVKD